MAPYMRHKARAKTCRLSTITALFYARQTEQLIINVPPTYVCIFLAHPLPLPLPPSLHRSLACLIRRKTVDGVKFTRTVEQTLKRKHALAIYAACTSCAQTRGVQVYVSFMAAQCCYSKFSLFFLLCAQTDKSIGTHMHVHVQHAYTQVSYTSRSIQTYNNKIMFYKE